MVKTLERPEVTEHEGDTLLHEGPRHVEAPEIRPEVLRPSEPEITEAPKRPIRWMRWLAAVVVLVVGIGAAVMLLGGEGTQTTPAQFGEFTTADHWERVLTPSQPVVAVTEFTTADHWERVLSAAPSAAVTVEEFHTPDYWEHMFQQ